jgi:hypothetical protein
VSLTRTLDLVEFVNTHGYSLAEGLRTMAKKYSNAQALFPTLDPDFDAARSAMARTALELQARASALEAILNHVGEEDIAAIRDLLTPSSPQG